MHVAWGSFKSRSLFDRGRGSRGSFVILEELGVLNALNMLEIGKRNVAFEN